MNVIHNLLSAFVILVVLCMLVILGVYWWMKRQAEMLRVERIKPKRKKNLVLAENYEHAGYFAMSQHWGLGQWAYVSEVRHLRGFTAESAVIWVHETAQNNPLYTELMEEVRMIEFKGRRGELQIMYP